MGAVYLQLAIAAILTTMVFFGLRFFLRRNPTNRVAVLFKFHADKKNEIVLWWILFAPILWCVLRAVG